MATTEAIAITAGKFQAHLSDALDKARMKRSQAGMDATEILSREDLPVIVCRLDAAMIDAMAFHYLESTSDALHIILLCKYVFRYASPAKYYEVTLWECMWRSIRALHDRIVMELAKRTFWLSVGLKFDLLKSPLIIRCQTYASPWYESFVLAVCNLSTSRLCRTSVLAIYGMNQMAYFAFVILEDCHSCFAFEQL